MKLLIFKSYLWLFRKRSLWLRLVLCWMIGLFALNNDEVTGHDRRFQLRGDQAANTDIALIILKPSDLSRIYDSRTHSLITMNEISEITDSFYWDQKLWKQLLEILLKQNPKAIGVSFYFGENIGAINTSPNEKLIFQNSKVFWSATINSLDRVLVPVFTNEKGSNIGSHEIKKDDDGIVRRILSQQGDIPHLAEKMTGQSFGDPPVSFVLNYRGSPKVFQTYSLSEIMNEEFANNELEGKIILIGGETSTGGQFLTPLGPMNRAEVLAQIIDNLHHDRWIKHLSYFWYTLIFFLLTWLAIFIIMNYPQSVALVFYLGLGLLVTAISTWIFDSFFIWIPTFSPLFLLGTVWFIFVGYQASKIERQNFVLQQDQKNMQELEQLKNNFVSLISHDLKTPIAKIQGIVDRLLRETTDHQLKTDLKNLQVYGDELNRYIQSILKLLRVESREFRLNKEVSDLNEIIDQALHLLLPLANQKQIQISKSLEPLFSLEFDVTLVKEVIINLIENAIKYSPIGSEIKVTSSETETGIVVLIEDQGYGIAPDEVPKIWGKFVRGKDQDLKTKGSGLGLYLVKYFIELHGGEVALSSQLGQGTKVSFTLPFDDDTVAMNDNNLGTA